jgi:hypothetical protein
VGHTESENIFSSHITRSMLALFVACHLRRFSRRVEDDPDQTQPLRTPSSDCQRARGSSAAVLHRLMSLTSRLGFDAAPSSNRPWLVVYDGSNSTAGGRRGNRQQRSRAGRNKNRQQQQLQLQHQRNASSPASNGSEAASRWWKPWTHRLYFWASRGQRGTCQEP